MATTNYNLPTITGNMTADVVRDMNALAEATDGAIKSAVDDIDLTPVTQEIKKVKDDLTIHLAERASLTTTGHTQLSNAFDSMEDTLAATPSAVKHAYDRGNVAFNNEAELRAEFNAFKAALTEGFTSNQFSDGLSTLDAFIVVAGYYNLPLTRLEV